jgi:hypothetical protein
MKKIKKLNSKSVLVSLNNIDYKIDVKKLQIALSVLEDKKIIITDEKTLDRLLSKYFLYDDLFLRKINDI